MGWLGKLFSATPKKDMNGIQIDIHQPFWKLAGKTDFPHLLRALGIFLPDQSVLYFEGGSPNRTLREFFKSHSIPEQTHVSVATLWPKPVCYHVPATPENIAVLANLTEHYANPELAVHFHAYCNGKMILEWHDAFTQPMLIVGDMSEERVLRLAQALSMSVKRWNNAEEQNNGASMSPLEN